MQVPLNGLIATQDKMIAVINDHIEQTVVIGATPPPRLVRSLIYDNPYVAVY